MKPVNLGTEPMFIAKAIAPKDMHSRSFVILRSKATKNL